MKHIYLVLVFSLGSCASFEQMHKNWVAANCDTDSSYSKGVEDAQNGVEHNTSDYNSCPENIGKIKKSYSKGYQSVASNPLNILKDAIGGSYYECKLSPFTKTYRGSGSTKGRASYQAIKRCRAENNDMFCKDVECTKM